MRESYSPSAALPLVFCTFIFSCSVLQEHRISEALLDNFPVPEGRSFGLVISYEVESLSFSEFSGGDPPPELAVRSEPAVSRSKIKVAIYQDGTSDWLIKKTKPRNPPVEFHDVPKSDYDEISTIRIINNHGYFINGNGDVVFEQQMDIPSFAELILELKTYSSGSFESRVSTVLGGMSLKKLKNEGNVEETPSGFLKITSSPGRQFRLGETEDSDDNLTYESYVDPETGLVAGGIVLDETGNQVAYVAFKYSDLASGSVLEMTHLKEFHTLPDEIEETSIMNNYFENLVIENYLDN